MEGQARDEEVVVVVVVVVDVCGCFRQRAESGGGDPDGVERRRLPEDRGGAVASHEGAARDAAPARRLLGNSSINSYQKINLI